jgi:serine/threonine protein kinase
MTEKTLFQDALAKPAAERAAFLDQACSGQPELRAAVQALLAMHDAGGSSLNRPVAELAQTLDANLGKAPLEVTARFTSQPQAPAAPRAAGVGLEKPAGELAQTLDSNLAKSAVGVTLELTPGPSGAAVGQATTMDFQPSTRPGVVIAGRYTLERKLGEGGMGEVWVAKQTEPVKRQVALKLIKTGMDTGAVLARFEQERQALALMDHPHIARVLDGGLTPTGQPFFVMELVHGLPLTKFADEAKLTPRQRLELFVPICQAVQHAHQKGIVHRDLKPPNILVTMVDGRPVPKVIDFGVAKATGGKLTEESMATEMGAVIGTLEYMSPEQAGYSGVDVDTRADIYSLGVILYELLTGLRPIDAKRLKKATLMEMIRIIHEEEPAKPSTRLSTDVALPALAALRQTEPKKLMALLRGELDWVVMKCLEKQRDRRYETANGLARDIQRYLADEPVEARPPSAGYRLRKFLQRNQGPVIAASLVLLALVGGIIGTTWGMLRAAERAEGERLATLAANEKQVAAEKAAAAEKVARLDEERQRKFAQAIADFVRNDFLALTSVEGQERFQGEGLGRNATLLKLLERAAGKLATRTNLDPRIEAELCWIVGVSYRGVGAAAKGVPFLERAVELRRRVLGPDHGDTLDAQNSLGVAYGAAGNSTRAVALLEETLQVSRAKLGPEDPRTLLSLKNLALAYQSAGALDSALPLFEETSSSTRPNSGRKIPVRSRSWSTTPKHFGQPATYH